MGMNPFRTRTAGPSDLPRLVAMNHDAYPDLVADGVVFDAAQLAAHQAVFPEGQLIVEQSGAVVGALATLIVSRELVQKPHTWIDATSHGTFAAHNPEGDTLYLADVYSDPNARGTGVGAALYDALFALCRRKRLARIVAGGRLYGYHDARNAVSPAQYVDEVIAGGRKDRVLTSQLRAGFVVRDIMPDYLDDWRSGSYATLLVWQNPDMINASEATLSATA
jgi:GNAT superfamily N-acetyltransferase